ncbi:MAG: hypothetical protein RMM53_13875, partial [Bacteroidia bacterium]|nr:hypothetical protein [Bacteroidia bacterium]MDW8335297.1 hypothetical protein [Bacteroidia bacterium]
ICRGVIGEATITVYPDTFVYVEPPYATVAKGGTQQFSAKVYRITSQELNENSTFVEITNNVPAVKWMKQTFGPGFEMFDVIESVSSTGLAKVKSNATEGMVSTVIAYVPGSKYAYGFAFVLVGGGIVGEGCESATAANVAQIRAPSSVTASLLAGPTNVQIQFLDANGQPTSSDGVKIVVANSQICSASLDPVTGELVILPLAPGSTTVTVCANATVKKDIAVTVSGF